MSTRSILIADDDELVNSFLARKLTRLGYTVYTAMDGEEALEQARVNLPDLILLDVKMPILSGYEVCRELKSEDSTNDIPVVMLSAKAQYKDIQEGIGAGADKYLSKPITLTRLLDEIKEYYR